MSLSSLYLDAFVGVAKAESFSGASKVLHITQSALSQRIKNLEDELSLTLFLRTTSGVQLTEHGQKLLRYCQTKDSLESELLSDINADLESDITGVIRIGAYSTTLRSVIIPALSDFLIKHPNILCEFKCAQVDELPTLLSRGEVDFIVMDYLYEKSNIECIKLGQEELVIIESKKPSKRNDIILDHNYTDQVTESFFRKQKRKKPIYRRSYFDDCYGIINGVELGLGRAIMSSHLIKKNKAVNVSGEFKPLSLDVYLYYHSQPFYTKLQSSIRNELSSNVSNLLLT
jgi:DNA-binding transcriptional LysR family regulator